eukprot:1132979-Pyramimonas_sp.AAC.1
MKRHLFNKVSVQQFIVACTELKFKIEVPLIKLVVPRVRGVLQTQIVEDIIGCQKNTRITMAQKKFKKPEASMGAVLRKE